MAGCWVSKSPLLGGSQRRPAVPLWVKGVGVLSQRLLEAVGSVMVCCVPLRDKPHPFPPLSAEAS